MHGLRAVVLAILVLTAFLGATGVGAGAPPVEGDQDVQPGDNVLSADSNYPAQTTNSTTCDFPINVTDATGTTITLDERPDRITTTNPSAAQTLWELGAQDRVVGVTQFAEYLNGTENKTDVSAEFGVSVEKVVGTDPDLVLAPNASAVQVEDLRAQNLTVYHFPAATDVDDIATKTQRTGRLIGNCEAATDVNTEMNESVDNVIDKTADYNRIDALYPLGGGYVAADETFINEIMQIGGTNNVAASEGDGYPQLSDEVILEADPELILVTDPEASILDEEPYASTSAGTDNQYVVMNNSYLNQPAPRSVIESTETLATAVEKLQPEDTEEEPENESGTCTFPLTVTDATGTTITLDERPDRITTTNPSAAQTLWELGAQDQVVGVTQFAGYLNGTDNKTDVSAEFGVNIERVVSTNPDLVLAPNASANQVEDLRAQNLTVYHFPAATDVDDIAVKTHRTGRLTGNCEAATNVTTEMNESVDAVTNQTADLDRIDALYPLGDGYVAADETFINEIMEIGGTNNVAASEGDGYPQLSQEVILQANPELILVTDPEAPILDEEPYASTTAGTADQYVVMNNSYLNQPAPRSVIESTETLAAAVETFQPTTYPSSGSGSSSSSAENGDQTAVNETESDTNETTSTENETVSVVDEDTNATAGSTGENNDENEDGTESDRTNTETGQESESDDAPAGETNTEVPGFGMVTAIVAVLVFTRLGLSSDSD
ncbi:PGF-CTERM-anchored ABC transporter substrate-binding protein [Halorubrum sp. LN27]|uniref:PGF-CTERM-anchored ABC transporter substrate-binding protein n=1 Tax=Halorubrum sp. LN27 TaxID=2801032 RepID=UPI00190E2FF6|nr:PGF-CTERM-anchored ABC transporter substrate-binding protein [Halorubrum sp. LN27]